MADNSALTSIRAVVNLARSMANIDDKDDYKIFGHVLNGLRDLALHNFRYKNTIKVTPDNLGRIYFPNDCLKFLSVGVPLRGKYWTFSRDKAIVRSSDKTYFQETYDTDFGDGGKDPSLSFSVYTSGGGNGKVTFYVNDRLRYVDLVGFKGTECIFEYISSGIPENADGVEIPKIAEKALATYALWQFTRFNKDYNLSEREYFKREHFNEIEDLDWITYCPTTDEIMDSYYSNLYQGIKRL